MPQLFPVLRNLGSFYGYPRRARQGHRSTRTRSCGSPTPRTTRACGSPATRSSARTPGSPGSSRPASATSTRRSPRSRAATTVPRRLRLGLDPRVSCLTTSGFFLWLLGYPDRAVGASRAGGRPRDRARPSVLARVRLLPRRVPPSLASRTGRRRGAGRERAARGRDERPAALASARDRVCSAPRRAPKAGPTEGLRQMADGLDQYQGLRTPPIFWPMIRWMQAAAHVDAGTPGPGFPLIDEALEIGGTDAMLAPLFHIVRGDLSLLGPDADPAAATASYERAFGVADELSAPGCPSSERLPGLSGWRPRRTGHGGWRRSERSTRPSRKGSGRAISRRPPNSSRTDGDSLSSSRRTHPASSGLIRSTMAAAHASSRMWRQPTSVSAPTRFGNSSRARGRIARGREEGIVLAGEDHDRRREAGKLLDRRVARHLGVEARPAEGELGRLHDERIRVRPGEPLDRGLEEIRPPDREEGRHSPRRARASSRAARQQSRPAPRAPPARSAPADAPRGEAGCPRRTRWRRTPAPRAQAVEDLLAPLAEARVVRRHASAAALAGLSDRVRRVDRNSPASGVSHASVSGLTTLPPCSAKSGGAPSGPATRTCVEPNVVSTRRDSVGNASRTSARS